jgi:hypothetical protein
MARYRAVCPECGGKFPVDPIKGLPDLCPLGCGYKVASDRDDDDIQMPSISKCRAATDGIYRAMEEGSIHRMQMAKEMGVEGAETLKITNMRDNVQVGEISAMPVDRSPVTDQMDMMRARGLPVGFNGGNGAALSAGTMEGPEPNAGARLQGVIRSNHGRVVSQLADVDGRPVVHAGAITSDRPSLEVQNPLYRKRV